MSTMVDVALSGEWVNIYTVTSIAAQSALTITNKSSEWIFIWEGGSSAPTSETAGYPLESMGTAAVDSGTTFVWARGNGPILVMA